MERSNQNCCIICCEIVSDSELVTGSIDLKCLLVNVNYKLQESVICEACLTKVQLAYKFKILCSEGSNKSIENITMKEETNSEEFICGICKKSLDPNDNIPFFDSVPNRSTLIKRLTLECGLKVSENLRTCEMCHKSLLNFCTITNSIFDQIDIKESVDTEERNDIQRTVEYTNSNQSFKMEIKEDDIDSDFQDVDINCKLENIKVEKDNESTYQEFLLKNEEVDIKTDEDSGDEPKWKSEVQYLQNSNPTDFPDTEMFQCTICDYQSKYKAHIKRHMKIHKNVDENEKFQCKICDFQSRYRTSIKRHMIIHKNVDEIKIFQCQICEFQTRHKGSFKTHVLKHKNADEIEMFHCNSCSYQSKHKRNFIKHMTKHKNVNEIEMFRCNMCNYQSKDKRYLIKHMVKHKNVNEIEKFQCNNCSYYSNDKGNLIKHMVKHKKIDEIEKFQCQICEFQTKRKGYLQTHMLVHKSVNEIEMFHCNICSYQSKRKRDLKEHMLKHKNVDEIKMFQCNVCNFQTKHKRSLMRHMLKYKKS